MPRKDRKGDPHQSPLAEPNSHPQNARTGEALANLRVIVSLFGGGTHEFIEHAGRHIEKLIEKSIVKRSAFRHQGRDADSYQQLSSGPTVPFQSLCGAK